MPCSKLTSFIERHIDQLVEHFRTDFRFCRKPRMLPARILSGLTRRRCKDWRLPCLKSRIEAAKSPKWSYKPPNRANRPCNIYSSSTNNSWLCSNKFRYEYSLNFVNDIKLKLSMKGATSPWNIGAAYRVPDSNINLSCSYQQGRGNIQISCVPDESASLLGPNGSYPNLVLPFMSTNWIGLWKVLCTEWLQETSAFPSTSTYKYC